MIPSNNASFEIVTVCRSNATLILAYGDSLRITAEELQLSRGFAGVRSEPGAD